MRQGIIMVAIAMALSGCASSIMQSYVGKDINEVIMDYGAPINSFDMPDGKRAFQWHDTVTYQSPAIVNTYNNGAGTTLQSGSLYTHSYRGNSTSVITPGYSNTDHCFYTLFAEKIGKQWIVTGFRKPRLACE